MKFDGTSSKYLTLDMAGKWDNFEAIGERDGNDIVTGNFRCRYNSTAALFFEAVVGNALSALPDRDRIQHDPASGRRFLRRLQPRITLRKAEERTIRP